MDSSGPPALERRHSFRVQVAGRASVWRNNQLHGHYTLRDLCIAGCALAGGPRCKHGEHVELVLHVPSDERPLWLTATVLRDWGGHLALRFERPTARVEDRLQDLVVDAYARAHTDRERFALVVEPNPPLRRALVASLDALGEHAIGVATPLDALQLLLEPGDRIATAFIGPPRSSAPTFELVEFLARSYPRVRRVIMGDAHQLAHAAVAEATGEVHASLETPCSEDALRRLMHRLESLPHDLGAPLDDPTEA